jgi:hypothetical protein
MSLTNIFLISLFVVWRKHRLWCTWTWSGTRRTKDLKKWPVLGTLALHQGPGMCAAGRQQREQQCDVATKLVPLSLERDGMGLVDREAAMEAGQNPEQGDVAECMSGSTQVTIPGTSMKRGRLTTSRDKPPYEQPKKRSHFAQFVKVKVIRAQLVRCEVICRSLQGNCLSVLDVG